MKGLEVMNLKFVKPKCITAQLGSSFGSNSTIIVSGCKAIHTFLEPNDTRR